MTQSFPSPREPETHGHFHRSGNRLLAETRWLKWPFSHGANRGFIESAIPRTALEADTYGSPIFTDFSPKENHPLYALAFRLKGIFGSWTVKIPGSA